MKKTINYIKDGDTYVGYPVNLRGITAQGDSLEELESQVKIMATMLLEDIKNLFDGQLNFKEFFDVNEWLDPDKYNLLIKLNKYKEIYGDL